VVDVIGIETCTDPVKAEERRALSAVFLRMLPLEMKELERTVSVLGKGSRVRESGDEGVLKSNVRAIPEHGRPVLSSSPATRRRSQLRHRR
jgi:hypothetical protein